MIADGWALEETVHAACGALSERGSGFEVTASWGGATIPEEAVERADALRLADKRLYLRKAGGRTSAGRQLTDVLARLVAERDSHLDAHASEVAELAAAVGHRLGLEADALIQLRRAAQLHDIGKLAIPDAILTKPGPLAPVEWGFMQRHTEIGERVLAAAPSMVAEAAIVRDSHEAWDGSGYPRGLVGERIPLAARIVAVCDAYDAMVSERPYRRPRSVADAVAELQRCAGLQFDPAVADAFVEVLGARADNVSTARSAVA